MRRALNSSHNVLVSATACALFAFAPRGALTQDSAKPDTHGIVIADMDQQFFIGFEQFWASKSNEAALREQVMDDDHSPDEYRADTVRILDAWYAAVKPEEKLHFAPTDRVRIWWPWK
jgi:predicted metalloendopeptidase